MSFNVFREAYFLFFPLCGVSSTFSTTNIRATERTNLLATTFASTFLPSTPSFNISRISVVSSVSNIWKTKTKAHKHFTSVTREAFTVKPVLRGTVKKLFCTEIADSFSFTVDRFLFSTFHPPLRGHPFIP